MRRCWAVPPVGFLAIPRLTVLPLALVAAIGAAVPVAAQSQTASPANLAEAQPAADAETLPDVTAAEPPTDPSPTAVSSGGPDELPSDGQPPEAWTDEQRLDAWLDAHATQQKKERIFTGATSLVAGLAGTGIAAVLFVDDSTSELARGIGIGLIGVGTVGVATGITKLAMKSSAEKRLRRWRAEQDESSGVDAATQARFEGEFRADAEHARRIRLVTRWLSLGNIAGGALILGLTPAADLSRSESASGYATGAVLAAIGIVNFGFSFMMTPPEKAWRDYSLGRMPSGKTGLFGLAPSIGRRHAMITLRRAF